jgi:hypothetical protein
VLILSIRLNHLFILPAGRSAGWLRIRMMPLSRLWQSFQPSFEGRQHRLRPYSAFGLVTLPQVLFRLFIPCGNWRGWVFAIHGCCLSTFLPPFAPPVVGRLRSMVPVLPALVFPWLACATMAALTAAGRLAVSCPGSSPAFTPTPLPDILSPTTPTSPPAESACGHRRLPLVATGFRHSLGGSPVC